MIDVLSANHINAHISCCRLETQAKKSKTTVTQANDEDSSEATETGADVDEQEEQD